MKKTIYILSAFLTLAACAREEVPVEEESPFFTIRATGEDKVSNSSLSDDGSGGIGEAIGIKSCAFARFKRHGTGHRSIKVGGNVARYTNRTA